MGWGMARRGNDSLVQILKIVGLLLVIGVFVPKVGAVVMPILLVAVFAAVLVFGVNVLRKSVPRIRGVVGERLVSARLRRSLTSEGDVDSQESSEKDLAGFLGERVVSSRIRKSLSAGEYTVIDNLYLPIGESGTTQIDHIVVSRYGVFVIETKNYSGWIFASADSAQWTQVLYRTKNRFRNPIWQNYRHLCAISDNLGIPKSCLKGVVAFTGDCTFKTPMPDGVMYSLDAGAYIKSFNTRLLKDKEVADIVRALNEWNASVTPERRRAHVANLTRTHG